MASSNRIHTFPILFPCTPFYLWSYPPTPESASATGICVSCRIYRTTTQSSLVIDSCPLHTLHVNGNEKLLVRVSRLSQKLQTTILKVFDNQTNDTTSMITKPTPMITKPTPMITKTTPMITKTTPMITKTTPMITKTTPMITKTTPMITKTTPMITKTTPTQRYIIVTNLVFNPGTISVCVRARYRGWLLSGWPGFDFGSGDAIS